MVAPIKNGLLLVMLVCIPFGYADEILFEGEKPFEKIYVTYNDIVTMPDGVYFVDKSGKRTKVRALLHDWDGMYVMLIKKPEPPVEVEEIAPSEKYFYPNPTPKVHPRIWGD